MSTNEVKRPRRYCIVGAGSRGYSMFVQGLTEQFGDEIRFVGVYDINKTRCEFLKKYVGDGLTIYDDFETMLDSEHPDAVIVTTVDCFHHDYIIRAMEKGYDVFSEKPVTNTFERCLAIHEAEKRTGHKVTTTFNCRFMAYYAQLKEIIKSGEIGRVLSVSYVSTLDRAHGGDYFKRWHRLMENSQGMLLHKSTHCFDVINWCLDDEPMIVTALGNRVYYSNQEKYLGERCSQCAYGSTCESYHSQSESIDNEMYFKAEHEDGYIRDRCSFKLGSDINDNLSVSVMYKHGALVSYSLNLFSEHEGFRVEFTGEKGTMIYQRFWPDAERESKDEIMLLFPNGEVQYRQIGNTQGTHSGGDNALRKMLFGGEELPDPLNQHADSYAGFMSAMIGIAANESMRTGKAVNLDPYLEKLKN